MKALLMFRDRDFDPKQELPPNAPALLQDLELETLLSAMAADDKLVFETAKTALLRSLTEPEAIIYRQHILDDCLANPAVIRDLYRIAGEAVERERKEYYWGLSHRYPSGMLRRSVAVLEMFVALLKEIGRIADRHASGFSSAGCSAFFQMIKAELSDDYMAVVEAHLQRLRFGSGVLISAELGKGNKAANYTVRKLPERETNWLRRLFADKPPEYSYRLHPRDESGARALSEIRDRGVNLVANALTRSTDHILSFFKMLRVELAFYVGCVNLHERLAQIGEPAAFPTVATRNERRHAFTNLYDVCLSLRLGRPIVGNDADADGRGLVIVTGANQGGKSTFLRSVGLAQLMLQCGMFVPAEAFRANLCAGVFTHYKREEDATMTSGKLDEELARMSEIVDRLQPHSLVLFNESFAATNEREGSEIASQIVRALADRRVKVFFVTHLYDFAHRIHADSRASALFLRADRQPDGRRTFKLIDGEPLQTSYGEDLYRRIFGEASLAAQ